MRAERSVPFGHRQGRHHDVVVDVFRRMRLPILLHDLRRLVLVPGEEALVVAGRQVEDRLIPYEWC